MAEIIEKSSAFFLAGLLIRSVYMKRALVKFATIKLK